VRYSASEKGMQRMERAALRRLRGASRSSER